LPLKNRLPDPDDEPYHEITIAGKIRSLIMGDIARYPPFKMFFNFDITGLLDYIEGL